MAKVEFALGKRRLAIEISVREKRVRWRGFGGCQICSNRGTDGVFFGVSLKCFGNCRTIGEGLNALNSIKNQFFGELTLFRGRARDANTSSTSFSFS